ncbi:hypothetical protein KGF54_003353 [Candida jiufengensis]|uniref:uncharacterized protein n=1 Tax=Candida jiufengensis TaxID=497108 RepID=UPI002224ED42|nr:uncharacterized protein KGF54_003353 [Candida jiufengensis]KAI5952486.1 hypothetical protein KGF54_003353 [Candida jiufengensis]
MKIEELPDVNPNQDNIAENFDKLKELSHPSNHYTQALANLNDSLINLNLQQLQILSLHSNPNLSWSSVQNSKLVISIIGKSNISSLLPQYINVYFRPKLLEIEKLVKLGQKKQSTLRPRLSFREQKFDPSILAQAWFLVSVKNDSEIQMLVLLLIIDTLKFDIDAKLQACKLLEYLQSKEIQKVPSIQNLIGPLRQNLIKCLTHLPSITQEDESLKLLTIAYPCLYQVDRKFGNNLNFIEIIGQILSSIIYVNNYPEIVIFLLNQLSICIEEIKLDVLINISKIFYLLNNIITNINYLEQQPKIIIKAIDVVNEILSIDNPMIYTFVYDIIGAYGILLKRIKKYEIKSIDISLIQQSITNLKRLALKYDKLNEFDELCTYIDQ